MIKITLALLLSRLLERFRRLSVENIAIVHGMGRVVVFLFFAKLIAAGKEMLVAYCYGTSAVVDGYLFVFNLIMWPGSVFFSVVSFVLIPYLVSLRAEIPEQEARFRRELLLLTAIIGIILSALVSILLFNFVVSGASELSILGQQAAQVAIPWLAPTVAFSCLAALYSTFLMSERRHANTFLEAMPALCITLILIIWMLLELPLGQSPLPLVVGTVVGFALQAGLLAHLSGCGFHFARPSVASVHWQSLRRVFGVMLLAQVVMASGGLVDQFFAVRMGEGVLAVYSYAQRVLGLVLGFSSMVIGRALLPVLSGVTDARASWKIAKRWAMFFGVLGAGGAAVLALLVKPVVEIFFERGAFTVADTVAVSEVLVVLGAQLPFYLGGTVLVQWLGAAKQQHRLFAASSVGFVVKLACAFLLYDLKGIGLAWSTTAMYFSIVVVVSVVATRFTKNFIHSDKYFIKI